MKNFTQYLLEGKSTYDFKIKIANLDLDSDTLDRIEHALKGFDLNSISKAKRIPLSGRNLDFPSMGTCEVSLIDVSLNYPCTDDQVRQALGSQGRLPLANIVVIPKNQPEELRREEECSGGDETTQTKKKSTLETEIENISGGQDKVGQQRVDSMLKELESGRVKTTFAATEKVDTKNTNDLPMNTKSPLGRKGTK